MSTNWSKSLVAAPVQVLPRTGPMFGGSFGSLTVRAVDILLTWQERATQWHALAALETRILLDMGICPARGGEAVLARLRPGIRHMS